MRDMRIGYMRFIRILICLVLTSGVTMLGTLSAQTNISGIVNDYVELNDISGDTLSVESTNGFSVGDRVLIIQMQGAVINANNNAQFGTVTNYLTAGNYEFTTICGIQNDNLIVTGITKSYSTSGKTQVVRVPVYNDANINGTLGGEPWNGATGGVIAIECTGTLSFNAEIDATGIGFRGGEVSTSSFACSWVFNNSGYYYDISTGQGAKKGEGVALYINGKTGGRGPQANGGGGSNDHNGGGGGGSNVASGGNGGQRIAPSTFSCSCPNPGIGGVTLSYSNNDNKVFMGGGGGAGHENNANTSTAGSDGGGIVIIRANSIVGNNQSILANANDVQGSSADGAGGGGAGGTVILHTSSYSGTLNVDVSGADGGSVANVGNNCNGPGGGGSGGVVWINQSTIPSNLSITNGGGNAGITVSTTQSNCTLNGSNSATDGTDGNTLTDLQWQETDCNDDIPVANISDTICAGDSAYIAGEWHNTSGQYIDTISIGCCDSVVITDLFVLDQKGSIYSDTICQGEQITINGTVYSDPVSNAQEIFTGVGPFGCDSNVTINLHVTQINAEFSILDSLNQDGSRIVVANPDSSEYQWLLCPDLTPIENETNQSYVVSESQVLAVVVSNYGCSDTSNCDLVEVFGLNEVSVNESLFAYPNPTTGTVVIGNSSQESIDLVELYDVNGRQLRVYNPENMNLEISIDEDPGVYFLKVYIGNSVGFIRILKL